MLRVIEFSIVRGATLLLVLAVLTVSAGLWLKTDGLRSRVKIGGLEGLPAVGHRVSQTSYFERLKAGDQAKLVRYVNFVTAIIKKRNPRLRSTSRTAFLITVEAFKLQVDPIFAAAVIAAESNFDPHAVSPVGARGLMQVMPPTGAYVSEVGQYRWRGGKSLHDKRTNLQIGLHYIRSLYSQYDGNLTLVLMAYNWGPGNVLNYNKGKANMPEETKNYLSKVLRLYRSWLQDFKSYRSESANIA